MNRDQPVLMAMAHQRLGGGRAMKHISARNAPTHPHDLTRAETGSAVKPVIIPQLVDLDSFATVGRLYFQRHDPEIGRGVSSLRATAEGAPERRA